MLLNDIVVMEDAGSLSQVPKAWWSTIAGRYGLGGQDSDIVQVGQDILGGKTLEPRAKAKRLITAIERGAERYGNKIAGAFIKVDDQPFALIKTGESLTSSREKYAAIFASGEKASTREVKTRVQGYGAKRMRHQYSYQREQLNLEELGYKLPDEGRIDVYIVLLDPVRLQKRQERVAAKAGTKDERLTGVKAAVGKKFIKQKASTTIEHVKQLLSGRFGEIAKKIDQVVNAAVDGTSSNVNLTQLKTDVKQMSELMYPLEQFISNLERAMKEGSVRSGYGPGVAYQYKDFVRSIETLEKALKGHIIS